MSFPRGKRFVAVAVAYEYNMELHIGNFCRFREAAKVQQPRPAIHHALQAAQAILLNSVCVCVRARALVTTCGWWAQVRVMKGAAATMGCSRCSGSILMVQGYG